jgi:hypothetical protein
LLHQLQPHMRAGSTSRGVVTRLTSVAESSQY